MNTTIRSIILFASGLLLAIFVSPIQIVAQSEPAIQWQKAFGGGGGENAISLAATLDGGCIVTGMTWSGNDGDVQGKHGKPGKLTSSPDMWVTKLSSSGILQWQRCLGGSSSEYGEAIIQSSDGGYLVGGSTASIDGDIKDTTLKGFRPWVVKLNNSGTIEWERSIGGSGGEVKSVIQSSDGGFIACISSSYPFIGSHGGNDICVAKLTPTGEISWVNCYGESGDEGTFASIAQTADGGYIVGSDLSSQIPGNHGQTDAWVVKLDSVGSVEWQKCYGGSDVEYLGKILQTPDGGYIFAGSTYSKNGDVSSNHFGDADGWVVKLNSEGVIEWEKSYGSDSADFFSSIIQSRDGSYACAGTTYSLDEFFPNHGMGDGWIVKIDSHGNRQWQKVIGGSLGEDFNSIVQNYVGEYTVAGISGSSNPDLVAHDYGEGDFWVVKIGGDLGVGNDNTVQDPGRIYPNPATNVLNIANNLRSSSYQIRDLLGREVLSGKISSPDKTTIDVSTLSNGIYVVLEDGQNIGKVTIIGH